MRIKLHDWETLAPEEVKIIARVNVRTPLSKQDEVMQVLYVEVEGVEFTNYKMRTGKARFLYSKGTVSKTDVGYVSVNSYADSIILAHDLAHLKELVKQAQETYIKLLEEQVEIVKHRLHVAKGGFCSV